MSTPMQNDLYAAVTGRIIAALERGVAPWVRPWLSEDVDGAAVNAGSRRPYRGINALLLGLEATSRGYALNRWVTYHQAAELGAKVRYGERGTTVVLWRLRKVSAVAEFFPMPDEPDLHERVIPLLRAFTVFNLAQLQDVPSSLTAMEPIRWEPEGRAQELLLMSGATIRHGGSRAFYRSNDDEIHLPPPRLFRATEQYFATALHELTHWTSHPSRCNRQLGQRFGDDAYALEELIAEVGSAFLSAHCRIGAQRCGDDLRPQPPLGRIRAEPSRRDAHAGAQTRPGTGGHPHPRPLHRGRQPGHVLRRARIAVGRLAPTAPQPCRRPGAAQPRPPGRFAFTRHH